MAGAGNGRGRRRHTVRGGTLRAVPAPHPLMKSTDRLGVSEGSMRMSHPYVLSSRPAPSSYEYVYRLGSLDDVTTAHAAMQRPVTSSAHRECHVRIMTMAPGLGPHGTARPVSVFRNWCRGVRLPLEALSPGSSGSPCAAVARPSAANTVPAAGCVGWPVLGPRSISATDAEGASAAAARRRRSSRVAFGQDGTKALRFLPTTVPQIYFWIKPWQPARRRAPPRGPAGRARAFVAAFAWRERSP